MGKMADTTHESSISAAHLEISMPRLPLGVSEQPPTVHRRDTSPGTMAAVS